MLYRLFVSFIFLCAFNAPHIFAQNIELSARSGYIIINHPLFPAHNAPALQVQFGYAAKQKTTTKIGDTENWANLYPRLRLVHTLHFQNLGNREVLGYGLGYVPRMDILLAQRKAFTLAASLGLGIGYLSRKYDYFTNPDNIIVGSKLNACATVQLRLRYAVHKNWQIAAEAGLIHYSNAGTATPNVGINIGNWGLGLSYSFLADSSQFYKPKKPKLTALLTPLRGFSRLAPFVSAGVGLTAKGQGGPMFPIYLLTAGARFSPNIKHIWALSGEYGYSTATAELYRHGGRADSAKIGRIALMAQHDFVFGHWSLAAAVGAYLGRHAEQRSRWATKVGFSYYPRHFFAQQRHQIWLGLFIRAYLGEAEALELQIGYKF
jgi:hypothetical protein